MSAEATDHSGPLEAEIEDMDWPTVARSTERVTDPEEAPEDALPLAPAPPGPADEADAARKLRDLTTFYLYGVRPEDAGEPAAPPVPALFKPFMDLIRVRHDYPVCVNGTGGTLDAVPLSRIVDDVVAAVGEEGDAGEQLKRTLYRLEARVKENTNLGDDTAGRLSEMWDTAAAQILKNGSTKAAKRGQLETQLRSARSALTVDGELVGCHRDAPARVFGALMNSHWREVTAQWRGELAEIVGKLEAIERTDFERSEDALSPGRLRESLGQDEFDPDMMSTILSGSPHAEPIPDARRERVFDALQELRKWASIYDSPVSGAAPAPFAVTDLATDCREAAGRYAERMREMVAFFKAVRVARLEIANGYRESVHDKFFATFDASHLTQDELRLCPPVGLHVRATSAADAELATLLTTLATGVPVKVLITLDELCTDGTGAGGEAVATWWPTRLASMLAAQGDAFVAQAPVSRFDAMSESMRGALRYDGPAVVSVYTGHPVMGATLPPYLTAAAATECRLFPVFVSDPARGETLAARVSIDGNPHPEQDWSVETLAYRNADDEPGDMKVALTPADYFYTDRRLAQHAWVVPPERWHDNMLPLADFLAAGAPADGTGGPSGTVPYITAVDEENTLCRVVVSRAVVDSVVRSRSFWRYLQELGGINNSHAAVRIEAERQRLQEEKQQEIEAIEADYVSQLEQDVGELTKEIVGRIAGHLLALDGEAPAVAPSPGPSRPASAADTPTAETSGAAPADPEVPAVDEEEDDLALDDAYIDTPLCTSCNECTQLNPQLFAYDANKQAYVKNPKGGPYRDIVRAAEMCPVHIIHPGRPHDDGESDLEEWVKRAAPYQ